MKEKKPLDNVRNYVDNIDGHFTVNNSKLEVLVKNREITILDENGFAHEELTKRARNLFYNRPADEATARTIAEWVRFNETEQWND